MSERRVPLKNVEKRRIPAQERGKQSVDKIFDATKQLLDQVGVDRLSTKRISTVAGMSTGALYNFFPNKESILYAIAEAWLIEVRGAFEQESPMERSFDSPYDWIDRTVTRVAEKYYADPLVAKYYNALTVIPDLRKLDTQHDEASVEILSRSQAYFSPSLDTAQAEANGHVIVQLLHGVLASGLDREPEIATRMVSNLRFCLCTLVGKHLLD